MYHWTFEKNKDMNRLHGYIQPSNITCSVCCNTQTKYWIPVLKTYWSIINSMVFQIIPVQYQYSIEILHYFSVSLSVFQKKIKGSKFEYIFHSGSVYTLFSYQLSKFLPEMPNCSHYWTKYHSCPKEIGSPLRLALFWSTFQNNNVAHASLIWCY